ncbi:MAG: penicillin-binding protein 2 [Pseudomonadota bacterium]
MDRDTDRYRLLARRTALIGAAKLGLFGALGARLYFLQVTEREHFTTLAEDNRINMRLLPPTRGLVLDRFGVPLAVNNQNFRVVLVAEQTEDVDRTIEQLADIVPLDEDDWDRVYRDLARRRPFVPITVRDKLTWEQVSTIEVNTPELPGLSIDVGDARHYPFKDATAHFLGYVGAVSEEELDGDPVLALPDFRIGKIGIEKRYEDVLRGHAGTSQVEVNAVGRVIRELDRSDGTPGQDLHLTIDIGLQSIVQELLSKEYSAAAVVMDVHNGDVYSLVSSPSYDPNLFAGGIGTHDWRRLLNDPYNPLTNKAVTGQYSPGSTFKMITALAALEAGVANTETSVWCPGFMRLGNHRFHCWRHHGHGWMELKDAIEQSCDIYFYEMALKVGVDRIAEMANRFGLGQKLGLDIPGESEGLIPTQAWKQATIGEPWQKGESLVSAIGQGFVLATPMQLAVMTARLVNGGKAVTPRLSVLDPADTYPIFPDIGVSEQSLRAVVKGMEAVVVGRRGTARASSIDFEGMQMGGKTGTSQVKRITMAERAAGIVKQEDRPWRDRHHALFVGFAPIEAPRYATAVVVEHGGSGSKSAAPLARDILIAAQNRQAARPMSWVEPTPVGEVAGVIDSPAGQTPSDS